MEYSINKLAKLAGISTRTLRYYDDIALLKPCRINMNGYRIYSETEVETLQQIMFYRALGIELLQIKHILDAPGFDKEQAMEQHLDALLNKRAQLDLMIQNAVKTIRAMKGDHSMTDTEKFSGFKEKLIAENEKNYGKEIREKYGDDVINKSNHWFNNMSEEKYLEAEGLAAQINDALAAAFADGRPDGKLAQDACALHEKWLRIYYPGYTGDYHRGLGQMYAEDERFAAYYEKIAQGCAAFFRDAINIYCT